ncbi:1,4-dihydroxy-2-naphthoate polyprenyltransferase [Jeotgalibaca sp. PTS2502]|uniref:1,4-dihydroxy-2-naphthoate polyprenyltransferase n=1 Tax=Jeotgalibaca sp. PTS2502 TaxID=1903686 RepID=UPI000973A7EA|nr:1,4-dihydroxy-2-naphthoate polyprenyltransferase [Jeotgalibaca sp. PTS2502]APZ49758.1 1,4-dihydroxy-2-naphthoate polyprenyltransferase [Jeotgalibaca sp. PTS2502]
MLTMPVFLELVEIKTKLASLFPFLLGTLFSAYYFSSFDGWNTFLFFVAMIIFDMATTAINNTMDYVKAKNTEYRDGENILGRAGISVEKATRLIVTMVMVAAAMGIVLTYRTNSLLLVIGAICFLIGILYTFGPFPISRMPLGEVLSGLTMGFGIFFIAVFINVPGNELITLVIDWPAFHLEGHLLNVLIVFLNALPLVFTIANIMLANNTCDFETDVSNHRYTLVYYIGKPLALKLYGLLYYGVFAAVILAVVLRVTTVWMLLVVLLFPLVQKNIKTFQANPDKASTFAIAIKNLVLIHGVQIVALVLAVVFS